MQIEKGLFAGVEIPESDLAPYKDENGQPRFRADGTPLLYWPSALRTPLFLEKFPLQDGWCVRISNTLNGIELPDRYRGEDGSVVMQPTVMFTAQLIKEGLVYAEATSLVLIWGVSAWEIGESVVRGRLYDALGLSYARGIDNAGAYANKPETGASSTPQGQGKVTPIRAEVSVPASANAAAPAAATVSEPSPSAEPSSEPATAVESAPEAPAHAEAAPVDGKPATDNKHIEANLMRQIEIQAASRGVEIPVFADKAQAKAFFSDLLNNKLERRAS